MPVLTQVCILNNQHGLHIRAAGKLANLAAKFSSEITISKQIDNQPDGAPTDAKSMMGLMMLAAGNGTQVLLTVKGNDAEQALASLKELIGDDFGE